MYIWKLNMVKKTKFYLQLNNIFFKPIMAKIQDPTFSKNRCYISKLNMVKKRDVILTISSPFNEIE